ncbi:MAG: hypothetical protein ACJ72Y_04405 [Actinomycetes bacterium]
MTTQLTTTKPPAPAEPARWWQASLNGAYVLIGAMTAGWAVGWLGIHVAHDTQPLWLLARISGLAAMILLTGLVSLGLLLAHPRGTVLRSINRRTLLSIHIGLAAFTAVFIVLHVVVLATDKYAGVGWAGVFLPLGASYRPIPVTLGWLALYSGLAAGITARFAGRLGRVWWPIHRVAIVVYAAAWLHGLLAGSDSAALILTYAGSLLLVLSVAASRYLTDPIRKLPRGVR